MSFLYEVCTTSIMYINSSHCQFLIELYSKCHEIKKYLYQTPYFLLLCFLLGILLLSLELFEYNVLVVCDLRCMPNISLRCYRLLGDLFQLLCVIFSLGDDSEVYTNVRGNILLRGKKDFSVHLRFPCYLIL